MESIRASSIEAFVPKVAAAPNSEAPAAAAAPAASPVGEPIAPMNQDSASVGGGQASTMSLGNWQIQADITRKLAKAARGEVDFELCLPQAPSKPSTPAPGQPAGGSGWMPSMSGNANGETGTNYTTPGESVPGNSGWDPSQNQISDGGAGDGAGDPLVFDLNADGDTDATVDQHGIDVDGLKHTKWAEKGDGVLAMGDEPLDTEGGKYKDAFENLRDKAAQAGIDVSKGYLDKADLQKLEEQGLTMMVSNGDGTNTPMKPTDLGITQMSLGGKKVDLKDSAGNRITEQGSFVRNGQTNVVNDMWFNQI